MGIIEELRSAALAVGMTKANASACMRAADTIEEMRAWYNLPDHANLRCLESSVKSLIATLCHHDVRILRQPQPTGTISGDLYATVANCIGNSWTDDTLSDLQRRYPLPKPIDAAQAGVDGSGKLPGVRSEIPDGGGSAEHRGICGPTYVEPPVKPEAADGNTESVLAAAVSSLLEDLKEAPVVGALVRRKELSAAVEKLNEHRQAHLRSRPADKERLELARSEVRRNILAVVEGLRSDFDGSLITEVGARLMPAADLAIAEAAIRAAHGDKVRARRFVLIEVRE